MKRKNSLLIGFLFAAILVLIGSYASYALEAKFEKENSEAVDLAQRGRYKDAMRIFRKSLSRDKQVAISYHNIGYTYFLEGKPKQAKEYYQKSINVNPKLVPPRAKLGKILYEEKNYKGAIDQGERVLKLDPKERSVKGWLPDAYEKYTEQRIIEMSRKRIKGTGHTTEDVSAAFDPFAALRRLGWRSFKLEYGVKNIMTLSKEGGSLKYRTYPIGLKVPMSFYLEVRSLLFQVNLQFESPYPTGLANPQFIERESTLELIYYHRKFSFGAGFKLIEANLSNLDTTTIGISNFPVNPILSEKMLDFKLGLKFGYNSKGLDIDFTVYPRYLFRDTANGIAGSSVFDRNFALATLRTKGYENSHFWKTRYIVGFELSEWYVTEYFEDSIQGHYFGYYELVLGLFFGNFQKKNEDYPVEIGFLIRNRLFFRDLSDNDPFAFGNGQGFFGLSTDDITSRIPFPGFLYTSHAIQPYVKARFFNFLILEGALGFEFAPNKSAPFNFLLFYIKISAHY